MLIVAGGYIADRVNKIPLVLTFLGMYFAFFTITAFVGDPLSVAEIFHSPDLEMLFYFAVIISDGSSHLTGEISGSDDLWADRSGGQLCSFLDYGAGLFPSGGGADGKCLGGVAAKPSPFIAACRPIRQFGGMRHVVP